MERITLKTLIENGLITEEIALNTPISEFSVENALNEKVRTVRSRVKPWIEKYVCSQTVVVTMKFVKMFPPEFYEET